MTRRSDVNYCVKHCLFFSPIVFHASLSLVAFCSFCFTSPSLALVVLFLSFVLNLPEIKESCVQRLEASTHLLFIYSLSLVIRFSLSFSSLLSYSLFLLNPSKENIKEYHSTTKRASPIKEEQLKTKWNIF